MSQQDHHAGKRKEAQRGFRGVLISLWSSLLARGLLFSLLSLPLTVEGQEIKDNFDGGTDTGWQHYTPTTSGGATPTFTFPTNSPGDLGCELFAPAMNREGLLQRG